MKRYELTPIDGRKSFYGKAVVEIGNDGAETLYSYNTPIIKRTQGGELIKLWSGWSATTGRHIKAFCGLNKAQFDALETPPVKGGKMTPDMTPLESYRVMMARRAAR